MPGEVMPSCIALARLRVKMFEISKKQVNHGNGKIKEKE